MKSAGYVRSNVSTPGVRVAPLGERHRAAVVPAVDDLGHARGGRAALRAGQRDVVDERPVRVQRGEVLAGQRAELGQRPDAPSGAPSAQRQIGSGVPQ